MLQPFLVGSLDVAELVTIGFFVFFLGLVLYLRREDRREGYPLEDTGTGRIHDWGGPVDYDNAKYFKLPFNLGQVKSPTGGGRDPFKLPGRRIARFDGAPIEPTGDPMLSALGPGAHAQRFERPDLSAEGNPRIVPLRLANGFYVADGDPDPRGYVVVGADGAVAGEVAEIWVDKSDHLVRFLETIIDGGRRVLVPMGMATVDRSRRRITVEAITARQFADVPAIASNEQITLHEEERIMGYFGGGLLYATPERAEPYL